MVGYALRLTHPTLRYLIVIAAGQFQRGPFRLVSPQPVGQISFTASLTLMVGRGKCAVSGRCGACHHYASAIALVVGRAFARPVGIAVSGRCFASPGEP